jgi:hypothetical protein
VAQAVNNVQAAVVDLKSALSAQQAALDAAKKAAEQAANQNPPASEALDVAKYLAANPDLAANWAAGGIMTQLGPTLEAAAREHYARTGKDDVARGDRGLYAPPIPVTENTAAAAYSAPAAAPAATGSDLQGLTKAVNELTQEAKISNVLAQTGYQKTIQKLDEVVQGQDDVKSSIRANAA